MQMIDKFYNHIDYIGKGAVVVGTGPSLDNFNFSHHNDKTIITINRACIVVPRADFCFFDSPYAYQELSHSLTDNHKNILMPLFSQQTGVIAPNVLINDTQKRKIFYYVWDHNIHDSLDLQFFDRSILNRVHLFISEGNVHSATHFCKLLGIRDITFVGIDSDPKGGRLYAAAFSGLQKKRNVGLMVRRYQQSRQELYRVLKKLNLSYRFVDNGLSSQAIEIKEVLVGVPGNALPAIPATEPQSADIRLLKFFNRHNGEDIVVCGTAPALTNLSAEWYRGKITIGTNGVPRYFIPNYWIAVDWRIMQDPYVWPSIDGLQRPKFVLREWTPSGEYIPLDKGNKGLCGSSEYAGIYTCISVICPAIHLALLFGAKRILLSGIEGGPTRRHFYNPTSNKKDNALHMVWERIRIMRSWLSRHDVELIAIKESCRYPSIPEFSIHELVPQK